MKSKFYLIPVLLFIQLSVSIAQDFAPVGAEWYYDITWSDAPMIEYKRVFCDTIMEVHGKDCKRINIDYCACNNHYCRKLYVYEVNDTVFFYNSDIDSFQILYDFNAKAGDSWMINPKYTPDKIDTVNVFVDSLSVVTINGYDLKNWYVTYYYPNFSGYYDPVTISEKSVITEVIGDNNYLINIIDPQIMICDADFINPLRCYQDNEFGFYSTNLRDSCTYTNVKSNIREISDELIKVYPNPTSGLFTIQTKGQSISEIRIYNSLGQIVKSEQLTVNNDELTVDLSGYAAGMYLVQLSDNYDYFKTLKILKTD